MHAQRLNCEVWAVSVLQLAVTYLPAPSMVLYAQLATSAAAAVLLNELGVVETDKLEGEKARAPPTRHPGPGATARPAGRG
jgi:hypothetical protein